MSIVIVATNIYFILGLKLLKEISRYYKGDVPINFYFCSDHSPLEYLNEKELNICNFVEIPKGDWLSACYNKYIQILKLQEQLGEYVLYFDSDTTTKKEYFDHKMFIGPNYLVLEHFMNSYYFQAGREDWPYESNEKSTAFVDYKNTDNTNRVYYHASFFGGKKKSVLQLCRFVTNKHEIDKRNGIEAGVNDESYLNKFFDIRKYKPKIIKWRKFPFNISDKSGIDDGRSSPEVPSKWLDDIKKNTNRLFYIKDDKVVFMD